jgi:DNA segregation ATPase FtsK/SpoIIIE-like protein
MSQAFPMSLGPSNRLHFDLMSSTSLQIHTARDVQRQTLADLIRLASECAAIDARIEQQLAQKTAAAEKLVVQQVAKITADSVEALAIAQKARNADLSSIEESFKHDRRLLTEQFDAVRSKASSEYDNHSRRIKKEFQDAQWLVESILDSAVMNAQKAYKQSMEKTGNDRTALDEQRDKGLALLHKYGQQHLVNLLADMPKHELAADTFDATKDALGATINRLDKLTLAGLFVGIWPFLTGALVIGLATAATKPWEIGPDHPWQPSAWAFGLSIVFVLASSFVLLRVSGKQIRRTWEAAVDQLSKAHAALDQRMADADVLRDKTIADAKVEQDAEAARVNNRFQPLLERAKQRRDETIEAATQKHDQDLKLRAKQRDDELNATRNRHEVLIKQMAAQKDAEIATVQTQQKETIRKARSDYDTARTELQERWDDGLAATKAQNRIQSAPSSVRIGSLTIDLARIAEESGAAGKEMRLVPPPPYDVPAWLSMPRQASLLIEHDRAKRDEAIELIRATMFNLLTTLPAGRVKFSLIDPIGLGQSFAGFMHLADHDDSLVGGRIWSEADDIEQRLSDLTEHMETVIQKYLRNEFTTIDEYNEQAGELAEPYRFLVIADLPTSFSDEALRRLANIATTGARCGVYVLVTRDSRVPLAANLLEDLRNSCTVLQQKDGRFVWRDEVFGRFQYTAITRPDDDAMTQVMHEVGRKAKENKRVEVPFDLIIPKPEEMWSLSADSDVGVPVGRTGATRLQTFRLGRGVAQHALIAGKTGSGKSTLLNVLITNLSMWYSPDELELYLIDFKRGVEFKAYATQHLPHARAIAVESDREFGLSVLQRLDAEIGRRGELYRQAGVQDVASYRRARPQEKLPRILLIVDEFQELFTEDDKVSQEASLLIDRLVRQGRAFGIHVVLGSQTIGGSTTLPRTTMGQMAVRVALQCTEADSQLILGDTNSAARLLTRPGEAIYNDAGGAVENNSPFQISWLGDEEREAALTRVRKLAIERELHLKPVSVFEGNAPAQIENNRELAAQFARRSQLTGEPTLFAAALGEAVAIKPPTSVTLRRRAGANVMIIGQQEEQALATLATIALSISAQSPDAGASFYVLDATPTDSTLHGKLAEVVSALPVQTNVVGYRDVPATIVSLAAELKDRAASDETRPAIFVLINGLQRYRELRKTEESFSFSMDADEAPKPPAADKAFVELIKEGPSHGIHILAWIDTVAAIDRTFDRAMLREFDHRVLFQMSAADSAHLIDSPAANKLGFYRAIYFSEEQGVIEKFRPYGIASVAFVRDRLLAPAAKL